MFKISDVDSYEEQVEMADYNPIGCYGINDGVLLLGCLFVCLCMVSVNTPPFSISLCLPLLSSNLVISAWLH